MSEIMLQTNQLTKIYGQQKAVNEANISIRRGAIYGLIGRNGAGKTTMMKMICGLATPTSGDICLFGKNKEESKELFGRIGTLIENPGIYPKLSGYDNLKLRCIAEGIPNSKKTVEEILELVGLTEAAQKKAGQYSLGMRQRLGIGLSLVSNPDFIILDEPINGLDPQGIVEVRELIFRLNKERGITFMISSHILGELDKIATDFGIINSGVLVEQLSSEELHAKCVERVEIKAEQIELAANVLDEMKITNYKVINREQIYLFEGMDRLGEIAVNLVQAGVKFTNLGITNVNLEEYFITRIGGEYHA